MCTTWTNYRSNGHCELINQSDIKSVISVISAVKSVITLGQASVAAQELRLGSVLDLSSEGSGAPARLGARPWLRRGLA